MRSLEINTGITKVTTFPPHRLTPKFQCCAELLLHPRYVGYSSDPTGLHCLELHIPTGCGSRSNSKFGTTSLSLPTQLFPSQTTHSQDSSLRTLPGTNYHDSKTTPLSFSAPIAKSLHLYHTLNIFIKDCFSLGSSSHSHQLCYIYVS